MRYVNHLGAEFDFDAPGIHAHRGSIRDYSWDVALLNGQIASAKRAESSIPVDVVFAMGEGECIAAKDRMHEVVDADPIACATGSLYDGEWYVRCMAVESAKDLWWYDDGVAKYSISFYAPDPVWIRERAFSFPKNGSGGGLNFPLNFPFNFGSPGSGVQMVENPGFEPSPLRIAVYGPAKNPSVVIGGNRYEVACEVPAGGKLAIDGMSKTITVADAYGREESAFSARRGEQHEGSGSYAFQRLGPGWQPVSWDGSFALDVTVYEQRGERRWGG